MSQFKSGGIKNHEDIEQEEEGSQVLGYSQQQRDSQKEDQDDHDEDDDGNDEIIVGEEIEIAGVPGTIIQHNESQIMKDSSSDPYNNGGDEKLSSINLIRSLDGSSIAHAIRMT